MRTSEEHTKPQNGIFRSVLIVALLLLVAAKLFYFFVVFLPDLNQSYIAHDMGAGTISDLYSPWLATRAFFVLGLNPYSDAVTAQIQFGVYGRQLDPSRPGELTDEQRFAYPLFLLLGTVPSLLLSFHAFQTVIWVLATSAAATMVRWWFGFLQFSWTLTYKSAIAVSFLTSLAVLDGLRLQNLGVLIVGLISAGAWATLRRRYVLAGICLGLAMAKPQVAAPIAGWFILWSLSAPDRRRLSVSFAIVTGALMLGSLALFPGWVPWWLNTLQNYVNYTRPQPILTPALGTAGALAAEVCLILFAVMFCWFARHRAADSPRFRCATMLVLATTAVISPWGWWSHHQIILFPVHVWLLMQWPTLVADRSSAAIVPKALFGVLLIFGAWEWLGGLLVSAIAASHGLTVGSELVWLPHHAFRPFVFCTLLVVYSLVLRNAFAWGNERLV